MIADDDNNDIFGEDERDAEEAKRIVRAAMGRSGDSYRTLAEKLSADGYGIAPDSLRSKLSRGTFSAAFLVRVLRLCGVRHVEIGEG